MRAHTLALSLAGALPDAGRLAGLAAAFPRFMLLEETPSRLAAEVVEALCAIPIEEAQWSVTDFTLRTLPASIRAGLGPVTTVAS